MCSCGVDQACTWPEFSLHELLIGARRQLLVTLSQRVVRVLLRLDRYMLVHATQDVPAGGELTANKLGR